MYSDTLYLLYIVTRIAGKAEMLLHIIRTTHLVNTIDTASFKTDSPKTSILRVGSTSRAWNIASVATGSTADISDPNVKLKKKFLLTVPMV